MKKFYFLPCLLAAGLAFTACDNDDDDFNPTQETELTETVTFEGNYWDKLIDDPQYYGPMLYGDGTYNWTDETTTLSSKLTNAWGDGKFWGGGVAISNYIKAGIDSLSTYSDQLSVPESNGSKNFAVVYCSASVSFSDGVARTIKSMDIIGTTYTLSVVKNGDGYAKALKDNGDYLNVVITGYNGETETGKVTVALAKEGGYLDEWYTKDLTSLGAVTKLSFSMDSNDTSAYGLKAPQYFAFDNVVIKK